MIIRRAIEASWWSAIQSHQPDLILVSAGFDGHREDPVGNWNLEDDDYGWVTAEIVALADHYSSGRVVSVLEGGYDLNALARSALVHLETLASV